MTRRSVLEFAFAILRMSDDLICRIDSNALYIADESIQTLEELSITDLHHRLRRLIVRSGLGDVTPAELGDFWCQRLSQSESSRRQLIELAKKQFAQRPSPGLPSAWLGMIYDRIKHVTSSLARKDSQLASRMSDLSMVQMSTLVEGWPQRLLTDEYWNGAEVATPTIPTLPFDHIHVEVRLLPQSELGTEGGISSSFLGDTEYRTTQWRSESVESIVDSLGKALVIIGAPGSGKTTLMRWIAKFLIRVPPVRFLFPIYVRLADYSGQLVNEDSPSLLEYFIRTCGIRDGQQIADWAAVLECLAQTPSYRDTCLILLDGWDEVPESRKHFVRQEITRILDTFPTIISTRPSGLPRSLPVYEHNYFHIAPLSPHSINAFIKKWFLLTSAFSDAQKLIDHLQLTLDLQRLARNPFCLTLLCSIWNSIGARRFPKSRTEVYRRFLSGVCWPKQTAIGPLSGDGVLSNRKRRGLERLSFWLLHDAPSAPSYTFDRDDVNAATGGIEGFSTILKDLRLINQELTSAKYHFLHATLQEFLAASELAQLKGRDFAELFLDIRWLDVLRFVAGLLRTRPDASFWKQIGSLAANLDEFNVISARLAYILADAQPKDGGKSLIGTDLRDVLWDGVQDVYATNTFVDAYVQLDVDDLSKRLDLMIGEASREDYRLLKVLERIPKRNASGPIVRLLEADNPWVQLNGQLLADNLDDAALQSLRITVENTLSGTPERWSAIAALASAGDTNAIPVLSRVAKSDVDPELREQAIEAIGQIGGSESARVLSEMLSSSTDSRDLRLIVKALSWCDHPDARDALLDNLARRLPSDILVTDLLDALVGQIIHSDGVVVAGYLDHKLPNALRVAAASALGSCTENAVRETLMRVAREESDGAIRRAAFQSISGHLEVSDSSWLLGLATEKRGNVEVRATALEYLYDLISVEGWPESLKEIRGKLLEVTKALLGRGRGRLAYTAAEGCQVFGDSLVELLTRVCLNPKAETEVRRAACRSLCGIETPDARQRLLEFVRQEPNVLKLKETPLNYARISIATEAAAALARQDVTSLIKIKGSTSRMALASLSASEGYLFFADRILNSHGTVVWEKDRIIGRTRKVKIEGPRDVGIVIALQEEFDELRRITGRSSSNYEDEETGWSFFMFEWPPESGAGAFKCVASFAGCAGETEAAMLTDRMLHIFQPKTIVSVGIAAGIHRDVCLGDVIVATTVTNYIEDGKFIPSNQVGEIPIYTAADPYRCSKDLVRKVQGLAEHSREYYLRWVSRCRSRVIRSFNPQELKTLKEANIVRAAARVFEGPIASQPVVAGSRDFVAWLIKHNRKMLATEMEAWGVMSRIYSNARPERSLIIKGVSDFGDERKQNLDQRGDGVFRRLAARNSIDYLFTVIRSGVLPRS